MKIALGIEYCGAPYHGWQRQDIPNSVQEHVENALSKIADQEINVICAGRTDTGVHALHQVVHFETDIDRKMYSWVAGGNVNLPNDISILWAKEVDDDFHARFSATARTYKYIIINRQSKPGVNHGLVTWERQPLQAGRMQLAANSLIGEHDFTSFRTVACQANSAVRNVKRLDISRVDDYVMIEIEANAFLHHMVRNIAGVLIDIGCGKADISWVDEVLAIRDRTKSAKTASPDGLYLAMIQYPEKYGIPMPVNSQCAIPTIITV
ncbi:MAG: tRNA pseudouridine(38-40) synthase TruA [Gammaproteobacteria bacterium]